MTVKQTMQKKYPDVQVENGTKTPIAGIYEVFAGGGVFYVDDGPNDATPRPRRRLIQINQRDARPHIVLPCGSCADPMMEEGEKHAFAT